MHRVEWSAWAYEDIVALFEYVAEHASPWDADNLCQRLLQSTDKLLDFPRLYEAAPSTVRACAESVLRASTCCMRWTMRRKPALSWPL